MIRSGKDKITIPRVFINILGGIQPSVTHKLFANDRDTTGFIFRVLFAIPNENRIAEPKLGTKIPTEFERIHENCIKKLYSDLPVFEPTEEPNTLTIDREASIDYQNWKSGLRKDINEINEMKTVEVRSGIFGKVSEYAIRFAGILSVVDRSLNAKESPFKQDLRITKEQMSRGIEMAIYFYHSAIAVYEQQSSSSRAPIIVVQMATLFKGGKSFQEIGNLLFENSKTEAGRKKKAEREVKKALKQYPKLFNATV